MQNEKPSGHESVSIRPKSQSEPIELPSIRQVRRLNLSFTLGYFTGELWSSSSRDPGYKAPVLPAILSPPIFVYHFPLSLEVHLSQAAGETYLVI
jgi:hypothetical protein